MGKLWAMRDNISAWWIIRWGSTLSEQYVKNVYFSSAERTLIQKLNEGYMSIILSMRYDKNTLLRRYLDTVYMGNGIYGIQAALDTYFDGKHPEDLTENEIIEIITRIHSPNIGNYALSYADMVSQKLSGISFTGTIERRVRKWGINLFPHLTERIEKEVDTYCSGRENTLKTFIPNIPDNLCQTDMITLDTTIDLDLSMHVRDALEGILGSLSSRNIANGAVYIVNPRDGTVLAYIGNRTTPSRENAIDMITERRSVGSVLKPFLYRIALEDGADGESLLMDDTRIYQTDQDEKNFVPENYVPKSYWPIRLKEALGNSLNSASVRLAEKIGIGRVYEAYKNAWLSLDHDAGYYGYGIALWSVEVTLENVVFAYRDLTSLDHGANFLLADILSNENNRARTFGISSILNTSIPLAVKTGTSTDFHDNWTIGYSPDAIIGVWVGNADQTAMEDVSGVSGAGPIFHSIAEYMIEEGMINRNDPEIPEWVEKTSLCLDTACMQREDAYHWKDHIPQSRILDKKFIRSEFITPLTEEEIQKWKIRD